MVLSVRLKTALMKDAAKVINAEAKRRELLERMEEKRLKKEERITEKIAKEMEKSDKKRKGPRLECDGIMGARAAVADKLVHARVNGYRHHATRNG